MFQTTELEIDPKKIGFLKFIIEGYDGLAIVTTLDNKKGVIKLSYPVSRGSELEMLVKALSPVIMDKKEPLVTTI